MIHLSLNKLSLYESRHCVYYKSFNNGEHVLLLLYVDDMIVVGSIIVEINNLKQQLAMKFSMKDLSVAKEILGMKIIKNRKKRELKLSHETYIENMLNSFSMKDAKEVSTHLSNHFKLFSNLMFASSFFNLEIFVSPHPCWVNK